jgi:hypothetical protein
MQRQLHAILIVLMGVSFPAARAAAQDTSHNAHRGMMGMGHDAATTSDMGVIHQLFVQHEQIRRTVTNLPDGIRTVTESDDGAVADLLRQHVASMVQRVRDGSDAGLPMASPALQTIFRNRDSIRTTVESTANGVTVVQTSSDASTVAALQQHAAEVTELARDGMAAMRSAMMRNHGMMPHGMHADTMPTADHVDHADHADHAGHADSAFAALQVRGEQAMGVDQYTSTHRFEALTDGGRIELQRDVDDAAGVAQIRDHLQQIAKAFGSGDFSAPAFVHMRDVPGARIMAARREAITYAYRELPRGGELRILTRDPVAIEAIHEFLAFQRQDHRAGARIPGAMRSESEARAGLFDECRLAT